MNALTPTELRELDAWIAEHVMEAKNFVGVKKRGYWYRPNAHGYTDRQSEAWHMTREEAKKHEYLRGDEPVVICEFDTPSYTTDPAAAMMVLEKSIELLNYFTIGKEGDVFIFESRQINGKRIVVKSETLPLAICLFAKQVLTR